MQAPEAAEEYVAWPVGVATEAEEGFDFEARHSSCSYLATATAHTHPLLWLVANDLLSRSIHTLKNYFSYRSLQDVMTVDSDFSQNVQEDSRFEVDAEAWEELQEVD